MKTRSKTMEEKTKEKKYLEKIQNLEAELSASNLEITGLKNENKELHVTIKVMHAQIDVLSNENVELKSQKETKPETHTLASQTEGPTKTFEVLPDNYSQAGSSGSLLSQAGFSFASIFFSNCFRMQVPLYTEHRYTYFR